MTTKRFHSCLSRFLVLTLVAFMGIQNISGNNSTPISSTGITWVKSKLVPSVSVEIIDRKKSAVEPSYRPFGSSTVDYIQIYIGNDFIFTPRSSYCDLDDLGSAHIELKGKTYTLVLNGGDASEAYTVRIDFNSKRVLSRTIGGGEADAITEETKYHEAVLK